MKNNQTNIPSQSNATSNISTVILVDSASAVAV